MWMQPWCCRFGSNEFGIGAKAGSRRRKSRRRCGCDGLRQSPFVSERSGDAPRAVVDFIFVERREAHHERWIVPIARTVRVLS
jgi:hypothetical protein